MNENADAPWTLEAAERFARSRGINLSPRHWRLILLAREFVARTGRIASLPLISVLAGLAESEINVLFRGLGASGLNEIAGVLEIERRDR